MENPRLISHVRKEEAFLWTRVQRTRNLTYTGCSHRPTGLLVPPGFFHMLGGNTEGESFSPCISPF